MINKPISAITGRNRFNPANRAATSVYLGRFNKFGVFMSAIGVVLNINKQSKSRV